MSSKNIKLIFIAALLALVVPYLLIHVIFQDRSQDELRASKTVVVNWEKIPKTPRSPVDVAKKKVYSRFQNENPDIFVDAFTGLSLKEIASASEVKMIMAFAADRAPDVVYNNAENVSTYIGEEFTTPYLRSEIDQYIEDNLLGPIRSGRSKDLWAKLQVREENLKARNLKGEELAEARRAIRLKIIIPTGILNNIYLKDKDTGRMELWALPITDTNLMGINFRTAMFTQSQLVDDKGEALPPDNWDEVEQWSIRIALQDEKWQGWLLPIGSAGAWPFPAFLWQAGGRIVKVVKDANGNDRRQCALDEQGAINHMRWYQKWATLKVERFPKDYMVDVGGREEQYRLFRTVTHGNEPRYFRLLQRAESLSYYRLDVRDKNGRRQIVDSHGFPDAEPVVVIADMNDDTFKRTLRTLEVRKPMFVADRNDSKNVEDAYRNERLAMRFRGVASLAGERNPDAERRAAFPAGPLYQVKQKKKVTGQPGWVTLGEGIYAQERQVSDELTQYQVGEDGPIYSMMPKKIAGGWLRFPDGLMIRKSDLHTRTGYRIRATLTNAGMLGINHLLTDVSKPEIRHKRAAAFRLIRYSAGPVAKEIRIRQAVEQGEGKFQNARDLRMFGFDEIADQQDPRWREFNENVEKYARSVPSLGNYRDFQNQLVDLLNTTCLTKTPPEVGTAEATRQANILHFGGEPPEVMEGKRIWAWSILGVIALVLVGAAIFAGRNISAIAANDVAKQDLGELKKARVQEHLIAWIFLGPAVATVLLWRYVPLIRGSVMALYDFHVIKESTFIGMDNWILIFSDPDFWPMMARTILYVVTAIGMGFFVPIILALLLNEVPKGKTFFRTMFYLPAVTSGLIILFMWKQFYLPNNQGMLNQVAMTAMKGYNGVWDFLNLGRNPDTWSGGGAQFPFFWLGWAITAGLLAWGVLEIFRVKQQNRNVDMMRSETWGLRPAESIVKRTHWLPGLLLFLAAISLLSMANATWGSAATIKPFMWLKDEKWAMICIIIPGVWGRAGPSCLIYLAGLKSIPEEEYEAADLDGAGPFRKAWAITLPRLSALILINFVGAFIGAFQASQNVLVMTAGGPNNATMIIGLQIWMKAFVAIRFGYATALAWIMGLMLLSFTMYQISVMKKVKFSTSDNPAK